MGHRAPFHITHVSDFHETRINKDIMLTKLKLKRKIWVSRRRSEALQADLMRCLDLKTTSFSDLKKRKKANVLFIMGSGGSVNDLSDSQWEQIRSSDSFGINFWTAHPHVPDFYTFETAKIFDANQALFHNLNIRKSDYRNTEILLKIRSLFDDQTEEELRKTLSCPEISMSFPSYFTAGGEKQLVHLFKNYESITGKLRKKNPDLFFLKNASIVFATLFGFDMGFSDIVYCGVDGYAGSTYFYDDKTHVELGTKLPDQRGIFPGKKHKTMEQKKGALTAATCLQLIHEHLFQRNNVRMWVGTNPSILDEWLPKWNW